MFSESGTKAMQRMFDSFRKVYCKRNRGCNENDVERAFLTNVLNANMIQTIQDCNTLSRSMQELQAQREILNLIEEIR